MKTLITGVAGFIGYFTAKMCSQKGYEIVGIDNLNPYYQVALKIARLNDLGLNKNGGKSSKYKNLRFIKLDLIDQNSVEKIFKNEKFDIVIHLAAQAGVRYSIEKPREYIKSNIEGFFNILEGCRHNKIKHFIYASSSSVYGLNNDIPFKTSDPVDHPINLYAATKRSDELMAHSYSHLYDIPCTGLRFFTVYGPWGRPDMAPFLFMDSISKEREINVFNNGDMERDFTYVEDIVKAMIKIIPKYPTPQSADRPNISTAPFIIYNIGNSGPINLLEFIKILEKHTGKIAKKKYMPMQIGEVLKTYADVEDLFQLINFKPTTLLDEGIKKTVEWYNEYNQSQKNVF